MTVVQSIATSFERRRARQQTYDALRRRAETGAVTGGRVFHYVNQRNGDGYVHRVIVEREAEWSGASSHVRRRQGARVDCEGAQRRARAATARRLRLVGAHRRPRNAPAPLYAGVTVWNKSLKVMRRWTKGQRERSRKEWLSRLAPSIFSPFWFRLVPIFQAQATSASASQATRRLVADARAKDRAAASWR
jgi:hypothetical protein